ncbi:hypothetical protein [Arthrobacter oryzae]|uniref:hypothetical protein n=1 Tax=Arthrobacter oryzae TaxID=409290 RepID=UPI00273CDEE8|nr:hypothetical protein [Arthrobacter oryzae]WLQ07671.1 hypothetical protein Q8Z05_05855 [Arthrobacter oryzae]
MGPEDNGRNVVINHLRGAREHAGRPAASLGFPQSGLPERAPAKPAETAEDAEASG